MNENPSEIHLESWLVSAGRDSVPGAPLNVPLIPASNFVIGSRGEYSRDDGTAGWIRACGIADLIWLESPSNPLLTVSDLEAVCAAPRKRRTIVAVDNTFATPLNQQPLAFGATVSLQSATKFTWTAGRISVLPNAPCN